MFHVSLEYSVLCELISRSDCFVDQILWNLVFVTDRIVSLFRQWNKREMLHIVNQKSHEFTIRRNNCSVWYQPAHWCLSGGWGLIHQNSVTPKCPCKDEINTHYDKRLKQFSCSYIGYRFLFFQPLLELSFSNPLSSRKMSCKVEFLWNYFNCIFVCRVLSHLSVNYILV